MIKIKVARSSRRLMRPYFYVEPEAFPEFEMFLHSLQGLSDQEKIYALTFIFQEEVHETNQTATAFKRKFYFNDDTNELYAMKDKS